jgi:hypothetical protein
VALFWRINKVEGSMQSQVSSKQLRVLVSELMKPSPDLGKVEKLSLENGIQFNADPIELMATVLTKINLAIDQNTDRKRKSNEASL